MTDEILAPMIAIGTLAALFLWIPTLDICDALCQKLLRGRIRRREARALGEYERRPDA